MTEDRATSERLALAMSMVEMAVAEMAERGLTAQEIAIGLACHMNAQVDLAMSPPATARVFKEALIA